MSSSSSPGKNIQAKNTSESSTAEPTTSSTTSQVSSSQQVSPAPSTSAGTSPVQHFSNLSLTRNPQQQTNRSSTDQTDTNMSMMEGSRPIKRSRANEIPASSSSGPSVHSRSSHPYSPSSSGSSTRGSMQPEAGYPRGMVRPAGTSGGSQDRSFRHPPSELPPRPYNQGERPSAPSQPRGRIPGSAMEYLPILEQRFDRLEGAVDRYVETRAQQALDKSILPGTDREGSKGGSSSSKGRSTAPRK